MEMHPLRLLFILATYATLAYTVQSLQYEVKEMGGELFINCTAEPIPDTELSHWVLTDLSVLKKDENTGVVMAHGLKLHIVKVEESTLGDYFCVLTMNSQQNSNDTLLYFKTTVSTEQESAWTQFRTQTIVGVVAAVTTLVVMIGLCLVWRYRWRPEKQDIVEVNGGYDTADGLRSSEKFPEKTHYAPEVETGFVNESLTNSAPDGYYSNLHSTKF